LNISLDDPYLSAESYDSIFDKKKRPYSSFSKPERGRERGSERGSERGDDFEEYSLDQHTPVKRNREGVSLNPRAFKAQKEGTNDNPKKKVKFDLNGTTGYQEELPVLFSIFSLFLFYASSLILFCLFFYFFSDFLRCIFSVRLLILFFLLCSCRDS
jgi:hypothetical protein